jgi:hypothetical protein
MDVTWVSWEERDFLSVEVGKVGKSSGERERWESQEISECNLSEF